MYAYVHAHSRLAGRSGRKTKALLESFCFALPMEAELSPGEPNFLGFEKHCPFKTGGVETQVDPFPSHSFSQPIRL